MVRRAHEPTDQTRKQVEALAAFGIKHDAIAAIIGVSDETLRKYYRAELDLGLSKVTAQVANALVKKALSDRPESVNAAKFFLQSQAGWKDRSETTMDVKVRPQDMSDDELAAIAGGGGKGTAKATRDSGLPN